MIKQGLGLGLGAGGGAVWTPKKIVGINAWFCSDLSCITKDGSNRITAWTDRVFGKQYLQADPTKAPTWDATEQAIKFNGVDQFMTRVHTLSASQKVSFIYVIKIIDVNPAASAQVLNAHAGSGAMQFRIGADLQTATILTNSTLTLSGITPATVKAGYHMWLYTYDPTAADGTISVLGCDGGADLTTTGADGTRTWNSANPLFLGKSNAADSNYLYAYVCSMVSVLGGISTTDLTKLRAYFKNLYNVAK